MKKETKREKNYPNGTLEYNNNLVVSRGRLMNDIWQIYYQKKKLFLKELFVWIFLFFPSLITLIIAEILNDQELISISGNIFIILIFLFFTRIGVYLSKKEGKSEK